MSLVSCTSASDPSLHDNPRRNNDGARCRRPGIGAAWSVVRTADPRSVGPWVAASPSPTPPQRPPRNPEPPPGPPHPGPGGTRSPCPALDPGPGPNPCPSCHVGVGVRVIRAPTGALTPIADGPGTLTTRSVFVRTTNGALRDLQHAIQRLMHASTNEARRLEARNPVALDTWMRIELQ